MFLFYPDWSPGGEGCKNDGKEPKYMSDSPSDYLHSTLDSCCSTYFGWNYETCMGNLPGICARSLFYPDWDGGNEGCIDDGNEPPYMTNNAMSYLFMLIEDCCEEHYSWNYDDCVGKKSSQNSALYFPDWEGDNDGCINGGKQPKYMNNAPDVWMHESLADCCGTNYAWKYDECTSAGATPGSAPSPTPGSGLYYPDWVGGKSVCSNDGGQPAYMSIAPSLWMHATAEACCTKNFNWNYDGCIGTSSSGSSTSSTPGTGGTGKYYMSWSQQTCVQDCVGGGICGGLAQEWDILYDNLGDCCGERNWWNDDCEDVA